MPVSWSTMIPFGYEAFELFHFIGGAHSGAPKLFKIINFSLQCFGVVRGAKPRILVPSFFLRHTF